MSKVLQWDFDAWEDYLYWQTKDKKNLKRINQLLKDISRNPFEGIGKHPTVQKPARALIKNGVDSRVVLVKM